MGTGAILVAIVRHVYLHDVVFGDRANDPGFVGIPREVTDFGRVTAVNEEELGRAVFRILKEMKQCPKGKEVMKMD